MAVQVKDGRRLGPGMPGPAAGGPQAVIQGGVRLVRRWPGTFVFAAALAGALVVTWPLVLKLNSAIYGYPGDTMGTIADFWWFDYALHHGRSLLYNEMRGVPLGSGFETAYFDVFQVGLFGPLSYVIGPTAAYNVGMLSSFPLTAWVTFLLGRRLGLSGLAAAFAGLAFAFVPYHQEKAMVHLMHTHMELFPAFLYFGVRWRQTGSRWSLVGAGAIIGAALWTDAYMSYLMAVLALVFFVTSAAVRPRAGSWRQQLLDHLGAAAVIAGVAALFIPAVAFVSLREGSHYSGSFADQFAAARRAQAELFAFSAQLKNYVLPWHLNPLVPERLRAYEEASLRGSDFAEQSLTIGYTIMALAAAGIVAFRRSYAILLLLLVGVAGFVMSQPPSRAVLGISIPGPSQFLYPLLPIFRAYSRFGMLVLLAAALLAGFGFMVLQSRLRPSRRWILVVPFLLVAVEFNGLPPSHVLQIFPAPAEYTWLKDQPPGTLIEYPIAAGTALQVEIATREYTLYQQVHEHPMFNGATETSPAGKLALELEPYYLPGVSSRLRSLGIRYVFVHRDQYRLVGMDPSQPLPGYTYIRTLDGVDIYVAASPP